MSGKSWWVYVVECRGGSLYTGMTTDVERRIAQHNSGKGARYTRTRRPVRLCAAREFPSRSLAGQVELFVKTQQPSEKVATLAEISERMEEL